MTDEGAHPLAIRAGARWEGVAATVAAAEAALEAPLTDEELEEGWSETLRGDVLADVRRVREELAERADTAAFLAEWRGVDALDADGAIEGETPRVDAILDVDLALGDLERAERALQETAALLGELDGAITPSDRDDGFDEPVRDELRGVLEDVRAVLASGDALSVELMDRWADALRRLGFLRVTLRPGVDDDGEGVGFTRQRIEQFPPGRRFEQLAIYDGWLFNVAWTDTMADDETDLDAAGA